MIVQAVLSGEAPIGAPIVADLRCLCAMEVLDFGIIMVDFTNELMRFL
jgi:hypothetical protein